MVDLFEDIEKQTNMTIAYSESTIDVNRTVSVNISNKPVLEAMSEILKGTRTTCKIQGKQILVVPVSAKQQADQEEGKKVSGIVTDEKGEPLAGATVVEKGTTNGIITDVAGKFALNVQGKAVLQISYLGYITQDVTVGNQTSLQITLPEDTEVLEEVVVTALGIKRSEKALGYAVQTVKADAINTNKTGMTASALTGKVAGLTVSTTNEIMYSTTVTLRGENALIVIDGVPYENLGLDHIASEDIAEITVLKGATATALYGNRGGSGAILITTKRGSEDGLHISVSSANTFEAGFLNMPYAQTSYSSGRGGKYNPCSDKVWGDKLDIGREALQYNPQTYQWEMQALVSKGKNNLKNFMEAPWMTNDNVNITNKGKTGSFRNSLTYVHRQANWPNVKDDRFNYTIAGDMKLGKFTLDASGSFGKYDTPQEYGIGGWGMGYFHLLNSMYGTEYDIRDFKNYWVEGQEQIQQNWFGYDSPYGKSVYNNAYFIANEETSDFSEFTYTAQVNMAYEITPWLKASARTGADTYSRQKEARIAWSDTHDNTGHYALGTGRGWSINGQALLEFNKAFGNFNIDGFVGASVFYYDHSSLYAGTNGGLNVPGFYSLNNSVNPPLTSYNGFKEVGVYYYENQGGRFYNRRREDQSAFGKIGLSWKNAVFLDITGRNDWVSTLAASERSFFYPSFSGSIDLTRFLPKINWLNFWKIRGSWTQSKTPADVYTINQEYQFASNVWNNMSGFGYPESIRSATLLPNSTRTWEAGTAVWFLGSRLKLDITYYNKLHYNMQTSAPISTATAFRSALINSGEERVRKGIEITSSYDVIKNRDFLWTTTVNFDKSDYLYQKLDPVYSAKDPWIKEGGYVKQEIWARKERSPDGELIHSNGLPVKLGYDRSIGKHDPDFSWSWENRFQYKNLMLSFQFDGMMGGLNFNRVNHYMVGAGTHPDTDNQYRYDEVVNGLTNYVGEGVKIVSGAAKYDQYGNILEDTRIFAINNVPVSYQDYAMTYNDYENWVCVLDWFKLREVTLAYTLPGNIAQKLKSSKIEVSVIGRNLFLWTKEVWGTDPEYNEGGLDAPTPRQVGFNVKIDF
ncbi:MAG: SusC/RagA family TonB-linked outer membrane protein [Tannerella sp.]|nr:SusC/RagA family TonB-linked outer membrane protein [Tannerella sp.]